MRNQTSISHIALAIAFLSNQLAAFAAPPVVAAPNVALVTEAKGEIFKRGFVDWNRDMWGEPTHAQVGDQLEEGMQLGTGDNSWAQLKWKNIITRAWEKSVYAIAPNQRLVYLIGGELLFQLDKHRKDKQEYFVWTNLLQARIRGTTVMVQSTGSSSRISVLEGSIDVMNRTDHSIVHLKPGVVMEVQAKNQPTAISSVSGVEAVMGKTYANTANASTATLRTASNNVSSTTQNIAATKNGTSTNATTTSNVGSNVSTPGSSVGTTAIGGTTTATLNGVTGTVTKTLDGVTGVVGQTLGGLTGTVDKTLGGVTGTVDKTLGGVTGTVDKTLGGVTGTVDKTLVGVTGTANKAVSGVTSTIGGATGAITNTADKTLNTVTSTVDQTLGGLLGGSALPSLSNSATGKVTTTMVTSGDSRIAVFETAKTITTLYSADPKNLMNSPLVTGFTSALPSAGLIQAALTDPAASKSIPNNAQILKVPTLLSYNIGNLVGRELPLPEGVINWPPTSLIGPATVKTTIATAGNVLTGTLKAIGAPVASNQYSPENPLTQLPVVDSVLGPQLPGGIAPVSQAVIAANQILSNPLALAELSSNPLLRTTLLNSLVGGTTNLTTAALANPVNALLGSGSGSGLVAPIVQPVLGTLQPILGILPPVLQPITGALPPILGILPPVLQPITGTLQPIVGTLPPIVQPIVGGLTPIVQPIVGGLAPIVQPVTGTVAPILNPIIGTLPPVLQPVTAPLQPILQSITAPLQPVLQPVTAPLQPVLQPVTAPLQPVLQPVLGASNAAASNAAASAAAAATVARAPAAPPAALPQLNLQQFNLQNLTRSVTGGLGKLGR